MGLGRVERVGGKWGGMEVFYTHDLIDFERAFCLQLVVICKRQRVSVVVE